MPSLLVAFLSFVNQGT